MNDNEKVARADHYKIAIETNQGFKNLLAEIEKRIAGQKEAYWSIPVDLVCTAKASEIKGRYSELSDLKNSIYEEIRLGDQYRKKK